MAPKKDDFSSSDDEDRPLSSLAKNSSKSNHKNNAKKRKVESDDESEEEEFEFDDNEEEEDDDDDDYDEPVSSLKSPVKKKAETATDKQKSKTTKTSSPSKKKTTSKKSSSATTETTPKKKKKSTSTTKIKSKATSTPSSSSQSIDTASATLYLKSKKGKLISEILKRWWYGMTYPNPSSLPKSIPPNCDALDGFPGVYVVTSGEDVGKILDYRNKEDCPNFYNMSRKTSEELKELCLRCINCQREVLVENEGEGTGVEKDLLTLEKWVLKVNPESADKEATKVLKAEGLKIE